MVVHGGDLLNARSAGVHGMQQMPVYSQQMSLSSYGPPAHMEFDNNHQGGQWGGDRGDGQGHVPLWTFTVKNAGRDGLNHVGAMVGTNPFTDKGTSRIPVVIVPMIVTTHTIATGLTQSGTFSPTVNGAVTQDSGAAQSTCLTAPNNVPSTLIDQSPIFQKAPFTFGGTYMGNTQYIDAVQRAEFYGAMGNDPDNYHVLFSPVRIIAPVKVDVPANEGLATDVPGDAASTIFGTCGTVQFLDINWFDSYINGTILPQLAKEGIGPGTIPIFFLYNTNLASPVTDINSCCVLGYHSFAGEPTPSQLYAVAETDVSGLFPIGIENTAVLSHELGELVNDPYGDNEVPPWGHTGQVGGCQENLEDGDPLTGTPMPAVTMANGYTYQLQELAFFSWFYGGQSLGVNGWYSSNGSFTSDAGPLCGS